MREDDRRKRCLSSKKVKKKNKKKKKNVRDLPSTGLKKVYFFVSSTSAG